MRESTREKGEGRVTPPVLKDTVVSRSGRIGNKLQAARYQLAALSLGDDMVIVMLVASRQSSCNLEYMSQLRARAFAAFGL